MTTIAYDGKMVAADSMCMGDCRHHVNKLFRVDGQIIGCSGGWSDANRFIRWVKDGRPEEDEPKLAEEFNALIVHPDGSYLVFENSLESMPFTDSFFALGSGQAAAVAAMLAGANAKRAVEIACQVDPYSQGPVKYMWLKGNTHAEGKKKKTDPQGPVH